MASPRRVRPCVHVNHSLSENSHALDTFVDDWYPYPDHHPDCPVRALTRTRDAKQKTPARCWRENRLTITIKRHRRSRRDLLSRVREGRSDLERDPRRRGGAASQRGTSKEQVCVLVASDRIGRTLDFVTGRGPVSKANCAVAYLRYSMKTCCLFDRNASYRYFARDADISHPAVNLSKGIRVKGAVHVQNVNAYHSRFREWIARFHGVATHYLPNYLGWRWGFDGSAWNRRAEARR